MIKGSRMSEESRKKVSLAAKRRMQDPLERLRIADTLRGRKLPLSTREKMSKVRKGSSQVNWFKKGEHVSSETEFKKGSMPKRPFLKGQESWNKGKRYLSISGEKHWNWKGGTSKLIRTIRTSFKFREWRKTIFERDDYTCILCGARCGEGKNVVLNVDHIKPLASLIYAENIKDYDSALQNSTLWDISNGRTLCAPCHRKTDTYAVRLKERRA